MKYLLKTLPFVLLAYMLVACEKDDDEPELIVGKWTLVKDDYVERQDGQENSYSENYGPGQFIDLKSDGSFLIILTSETFTGSWQVSGNRLYFRGNADLDVPEDGYEIRKLTQSELQLYHGEVDGSYSYEITLYLSR